MKDHNCYTCKFRANLVGSVHSKCTFFDVKNSLILATVNQPFPLGKLVNKDTGEVVGALIELNPIGIKGGWAMWPINYDPVWIKSCNMYTHIKNDE